MKALGQYRITLQEQLSFSWADWFAPMEIRHIGEYTILEGTIHDQAMLHGVLERIRNLNLTLLRVECLTCDAEDQTEGTS